MSRSTPSARKTADIDDSIDLEPRTRRALEEPLSVLGPDGTPVADADRTLVSVVSHSGESYRVDVREGRCTCPDHEHRGVECKHLLRAAIALGERPVTSAELAAVDVDENLGANAHGPHVVASDGGIVEAGDDGEILTDDSSADNGATYTYHTEPPEVGGARYVRCEECGRESVPADPAKVLHDPDCSEAAAWRHGGAKEAADE